ncbi:MAG: HAMP domain-containing protein [Lachnospira eligens]
MTKEIKKVSGHMKDVAGGDLTDRIDVKKKNEFGDLENNFNNMVENMAVLIKGVEEKSGVIVDASAKIAGVSKSTTETVGQVSGGYTECCSWCIRSGRQYTDSNTGSRKSCRQIKGN